MSFTGGGFLGGGSFSHGPSISAARPGGGLPFAGVPPEMQEGVDRLLAEEPEHREPSVSFSHRPTAAENARLTLWSMVAGHRRLALVGIALVTVVSIANQAGPALIGLAIDKGMQPGHQSFAVVAALTAVFLATILVSALAQRAQTRVSGRLAARVMNDLRVRVFAHLERLGLDFYTDEKVGVLMSRMTSDIENLQQLLQDGLASLFVQALTMVVITIVLFTMDVRLALITLGLVVPTLTVGSLWFRKASERGYDRVRDGIASVLADLSESLHGVRTVAAHNRQSFNVAAHRNVVGDYRRANDYTAQINAVYGPGTQLIGYIAQAVLLGIGGQMVLDGSLSIGALVAFFLYVNRFFLPIQLLVQQYNGFQQGQASVLKLRGLLSTPPSVAEAAEATELPPVRGELSFHHVTFGYDPEVPVLRDVSLRIEAGETVAFVGRTGAGKSTMAKLITRFYDPTSGSVQLDGHDLRTVTIDSLRRQLGVVPQEPFLFAGTLRYNIAFACPDADDAEVMQAVTAVGLADVVARMPDGLDTFVHERGQSLSSGERQLIALARAFLARPRVLVLDEATSNLDLLSETKIEAALDALLQARTAVLIAHRLTTAMKADRIVVVDDGRIAEVGPHEQLLARGGIYAGMYATWIRHGGAQAA